uniref:Transient receptor ion channel domain-containing protein n=1 Tax=Ascaris lumbricoides TaxID=6252 RepID=A0A9J2PQ92_ASCLU
MLLSKDARIEKPHKHWCVCEVCDRERNTDSLHHSLKRINTYMALASPAWMSLTSPDPILSAFKLSWELQKLAKIEHEFMDRYIQLSEQCTQFACDLLEQCRSTEEVIAVLNKEQSSHDENIDVWASKLSLSRLKLAIKYDQKKFVSHPHCQQLLTSIWYEGFPGRKQRGSLWNHVICVFLILLWPVLALCYILVPKSRVGRIVRSPFMKFLYYSISFGCFLLLLTLATFDSYRYEKGEVKGGGKTRASDRGPPPTVIETLVLIWVIGDTMLLQITTRVSAYFIFNESSNEAQQRYVVRTQWNAYEPMLIAEALFAVANVFSFARIIYLFQTNPYLGPLQISLGCMLVDVAKFCFIFVLIISSFSIGLAQLYWYYDPYTPVCLTPFNCRQEQNAFSSIASSYLTLLWSLFSITKVEDTDVIEEHYFTEFVGSGMFIVYHMTSIIVLLNMLIAMMSHSFQRINDAADLEWKFHRTKLWMAHFDEGSSLAPPFNIIITPKAVYYFCCSIVNAIRCICGKYHYAKSQTRATIRRPGYSHKRRHNIESDNNRALTYQDIIRRLVSRFIHQTKKDIKTDSVTEDDLLEIKQDIRSLRYELRDDRRKEIVRSSSHIDAVKRDIMRTMSYNQHFSLLRRSNKRQQNNVTEENSLEGQNDIDDQSREESSSVKFCTSEENTPLSTNDSQVFYLPSPNDQEAHPGNMKPFLSTSPTRTSDEYQRLKLTDYPRMDSELLLLKAGTVPAIMHPLSNVFPNDSTPSSLMPIMSLSNETLQEIQRLKVELNAKLDKLMMQLNIVSPTIEQQPSHQSALASIPQSTYPVGEPRKRIVGQSQSGGRVIFREPNSILKP